MGVVTGSGSLDFLPSTLPSVWGYLFGQSTQKAQGTSFFPKLNSPDFFQAKSSPLSGVSGHCWLPALLPALPASLPRLTGVRVPQRRASSPQQTGQGAKTRGRDRAGISCVCFVLGEVPWAA